MDSVSTTFEHVLVQSRITVLDLLEMRGYDATPFRKLIGPELVKLATAPEALRMTLVSKNDAEKKAIVEYVFTNIKTSVGHGDYVSKMVSPPPPTETKIGREQKLYNVDPKTTEVIVLYLKLDNSDDKESSYDKGALDAWTKYNFKIQFFPMYRLVHNPLKHVLQPKFEIVPPEDYEKLKKEWYVKKLTQFPVIKFHNDPVARCLGLLPLDIVKITSYSPTAGEYVKYRVCAP